MNNLKSTSYSKVLQTVVMTIVLMPLTFYFVIYYNSLFNYVLSPHHEVSSTFYDYNYLSLVTPVVIGCGIGASILIYRLFSFSRCSRVSIFVFLSLSTILLNIFFAIIKQSQMGYYEEMLGIQLDRGLYSILRDASFPVICFFSVINILWYYLLIIVVRKFYSIFSLVPLFLLFTLVYYLADGRHWGLLLVIGLVALLGLPGVLISAGLRNKYSLDFLDSIEWLNKHLISYGFEYIGERFIGTSHPECIMVSNDMTVTIRYNAPLFGLPLIDIFVSGGNNKEWHFPLFTDHDRVCGWIDEFMRKHKKDIR